MSKIQLKPQDLKVGNYLYQLTPEGDEMLMIVDGNLIKLFEGDNKMANSFSRPIPLYGNILAKLGWKELEGCSELFFKPEMPEIISVKKGYYWVNGITMKYVHELQNYEYCFTGQMPQIKCDCGKPIDPRFAPCCSLECHRSK